MCCKFLKFRGLGNLSLGSYKKSYLDLRKLLLTFFFLAIYEFLNFCCFIVYMCVCGVYEIIIYVQISQIFIPINQWGVTTSKV